MKPIPDTVVPIWEKASGSRWSLSAPIPRARFMWAMGRGAAVGMPWQNILSFCGYNVQKEYYNQRFRKADRNPGTLSLSAVTGAFWEKKIEYPEDCYQGDYIVELAENLKTSDTGYLSDRTEAEAVDLCAEYAAKEILSGIPRRSGGFRGLFLITGSVNGVFMLPARSMQP